MSSRNPVNLKWFNIFEAIAMPMDNVLCHSAERPSKQINFTNSVIRSEIIN